MRIADKYLKELVANDGQLTTGPVGHLAVLRLALDLREAREQIAQLEVALGRQGDPKPSVPAPQRRQQPRLHVVEEVVGRFGDPRGSDYEEHVAVREQVVGSKVASRT
jgi:hypothetical protein